eukprot:3038814-Amphidinium_carterae.2
MPTPSCHPAQRWQHSPQQKRQQSQSVDHNAFGCRHARAVHFPPMCHFLYAIKLQKQYCRHTILVRSCLENLRELRVHVDFHCQLGVELLLERLLNVSELQADVQEETSATAVESQGPDSETDGRRTRPLSSSEAHIYLQQ